MDTYVLYNISFKWHFILFDVGTYIVKMILTESESN